MDLSIVRPTCYQRARPRWWIDCGVVETSNQLPRPTLSANYLCYLGLIDEGEEEMVQDAVSRSIKPAFLKSLLPILK